MQGEMQMTFAAQSRLGMSPLRAVAACALILVVILILPL
jgi:hypothetical protein